MTLSLLQDWSSFTETFIDTYLFLQGFHSIHSLTLSAWFMFWILNGLFYFIFRILNGLLYFTFRVMHCLIYVIFRFYFIFKFLPLASLCEFTVLFLSALFLAQSHTFAFLTLFSESYHKYFEAANTNPRCIQSRGSRLCKKTSWWIPLPMFSEILLKVDLGINNAIIINN